MKTRRKAIDCTLIRESKDHPGYFKYQVTIQELDGTTHVVPAYGKDMEDALERCGHRDHDLSSDSCPVVDQEYDLVRQADLLVSHRNASCPDKL